MKLITNNKKSTSSFYGRKTNDRLYMPLFSEDRNTANIRYNRKRITKIELIKSPDKTQDALVFTHVIGKETQIEVKELNTLRNEDDFENDARIIATYELLSNKRDVKRINLEEFLNDVKAKFLDDIRNAYKIINTSASKKVEESVYIYHIYALLTATMSIINELDFKPPVFMELKKLKSSIKLSMKIKSKKLAKLKNRQMLIEAPGMETRFEYIGALCREDDINSTFEITGNTLKIEYVIGEIPYREGIVMSSASEEKEIFEELMNIFNYTKEVQEEEE